MIELLSIHELAFPDYNQERPLRLNLVVVVLEYQERELLRMEKERELAEIKRQHEREIYLLRRKLHETMKLQEQRPKSSSESGNNIPRSVILIAFESSGREPLAPLSI